jgi:hypothetical protein
MAGGLPDLSYGPVIAKPAPVAQDNQAGSIFNQLADTADAVGVHYTKLAVEEAKTAGAEAGGKLARGEVARDANGDLKLERPILPAADHAYMLAAQQAYASGKQLDIRKQIVKAQTDHYDDPEGFLSAVEGIRQSHLDGLPFGDWAPEISKNIDEEASRGLLNVSNNKLQHDIATQKNTIDAHIEANVTDLESLIQHKGVGTPEYKQIETETLDLIRGKVGNPIFNYSKDQADLDIRKVESGLTGAAILGHLRDIVAANGLEAGRQFIDGLGTDKELGVLPKDLDNIQTQGAKYLNDIQNQARAAELDFERQQRAVEKIKKDAAEASANILTSQIIADPTKVNPLAIANDKNMTDEHKRVIFNFLESRLRGEQGETGAAFWDTYKDIIAPAGDPGRITDPMQIYSRAPKDLSLPAAQKLVGILKQRQDGESKGDFETTSLARFDRLAHETIAEPFGPSSKMPGGEESYYKFFMESHKAYEEGRAKGLTPQQLLTPESSDYIGKNMQSFVPKLDQGALIDAPAAEAPAQSWFSWFWGTGSKPFSANDLNNSIKSGAEGSASGIAALKGAIASGKISKDAAGRYAISRGWVAPGTPKKPTATGPQVPPVGSQ